MRRYLVASLMAVIVGSTICTAATAHEGWFVRVCPAKTEANRIHLAFSGGRQGFNWSWIKGRTPDETDLPRRFRSVARVYMRGSTASTPSNIQPQPMSVSGSAIISSSVWNSTITRITRKAGMIRTIARVNAA